MRNSISRAIEIPGSNIKNYLILFLCWPFLAFLLALKNFSQTEAKKVIYIFLIYYGLNFVLIDKGFVDAIGYTKELQANAKLPFSDFFKIVGGLYTENDSVDIYEQFISFVVSSFTSDHRILFAIFAAFFGFFYLKARFI